MTRANTSLIVALTCLLGASAAAQSPKTHRKMDKHQAYQLTSMAGDVAITQLVDGTMGVHVKMPKGIFR